MDSTTEGTPAPGSTADVRTRQATPYRTWRIVSLAVTLIAAVATALFLVFFQPIPAMISAVVLILAFGALLLSHSFERRRPPRAWPHEEVRTTTTRPRNTTPGTHPVEPETPEPVQKAGLRTAVVVVVSILVLAVLMAAIIALFVSPGSISWRGIGIAAVVVFAFMLLLGAPAWLAAVEEEMDEEQEEVTGEKPEVIR